MEFRTIVCGGLAIYSGAAENFRAADKWPKSPEALNILLSQELELIAQFRNQRMRRLDVFMEMQVSAISTESSRNCGSMMEKKPDMSPGPISASKAFKAACFRIGGSTSTGRLVTPQMKEPSVLRGSEFYAAAMR